MSTSPAQTARTSAAKAPLARLMEQIERARSLPEPAEYEPGEGNPLERLRRTMRGELDPEASPQQPAPPDRGSATPATRPSRDADQVGRAVLEALRTRPLSGPVRAEAVERLASQIDQPDPDALRDILALLVTGQSV